MSINKQAGAQKNSLPLGKQRNNQEVIDFLNANWQTSLDGKSVERMKQIDKIFGSPSQKITHTILIGGTNGKSLTAHFTAKLLREEGFSVGTFYSPHILTYNERFALDNEIINSKSFTEKANEVINAIEEAKIKANTQEILTQIAFNIFVENNVDVALLEVEKGGISSPVSICNPKIVAITRLTSNDVDQNGEASTSTIAEYLGIVRKDTQLISGDQNKTNVKNMNDFVDKAGAQWAMPIRKLVALPYPFEQLQGRCAALAERICSIFVNDFAENHPSLIEDSLVAKKKGQRGRPTLDAKRESELNPKRTLEHFWKETINTLPGRFQLLEKDKPAVLLDNASNLDALENLLLGIRLLHYSKNLKGLALIMSCTKDSFKSEEFLKTIRYFFKKTSGSVFLCPLPANESGIADSWNADDVAQEMRIFKIKAKSSDTFKEAFEAAKKTVNERQGLIVVTGSSAVVAEFWNVKGVKKN